MGRILRWFWKSIPNRLNQLEINIVASIDQLKIELADAVAAIAELRQAAEEEKQEIVDKLNTLDVRITEQAELIEQLKVEVEVPDSLLSELSNATASIRETTNEIKAIVS